MASANGTEMVYNGEVYNYLEVRAELENAGVQFRGHSDTEVLLAAYDRWGAECLRRLNGMFAFALFDPRRSTLFAARDRFGEKPLYYAWARDGTFVFASELKSLLRFPGVAVRPNHASIYGLLARREVDRDPDTFFEGISSLPPAHSLELPLGSGTPRITRYWDLDPERRVDGSRLELTERFRDLFLDSVRLRLRSDVAVGSSLSGGLDSSAIVGAIATLGVSGQHTFSATFPGWALDESRYANAVVAKADVTPHFVTPDPRRIPSEWDAIAWHQESPFLSLSIYAQWCVMRLAAEQGITVLLDGQGADEILGGYRTFVAALLKDLFRARRPDKAVAHIISHVRAFGVGDIPLIGFHVLPRAVAHRVKRSIRGGGLNREFAREYQAQPYEERGFDGSALAEMLAVSLTQSVLPPLLRYADRNSMAFSREVRLPFLDHRLVEFAFALPDDMKLSGNRSKAVLRDAMHDVLPDIVRNRIDKIGYAVPQTEWLTGPLREWAGDLLHSSAFGARPWIDARATATAWNAYLRGARRHEPDILRWLSLEGWARAFLDARSTSEPRQLHVAGHRTA